MLRPATNGFNNVITKENLKDLLGALWCPKTNSTSDKESIINPFDD
jgi:hypothetical protein